MFSPWFVWGVLGILLIASEMAIPGFTIFFFGMGGLIVAAAALLIPPVAHSFTWQLLLWVVASILSFSFLRKKFTQLFRGTLLNRMPADSVGEHAEVLETITPESPGRVRYRGTSWTAFSLTESFKPGDRVSIVEQDGIHLTVTAPFDEIKSDEIMSDDIKEET